MEVELGKLFIGGISWDTNEDRLREYFQTFGEVLEAVIMKDRATGRARGFGFVVFADPAVAERVVMEKHLIDGRNVEAKKAVPREDQNTLNRTNSNGNGSPSPARIRKIFVGGLASTVKESDFKNYFEQFGTITDVVVMYDHNTQRPRGFGFITYDSEDAVDRVLYKTFHELNGKMVEVKRAVPKELSPGPVRSQLSGYNYMANKVSNFINAYAQGYSPSSLGGYGIRMDGRFSPVPAGRNSFSPIRSGYGMRLNYEQGLSPSYDGSSNLSYGRVSPSYGGNSSRYSSPMGYNGGNGGSGFVLNSTARNLWGNEGISHASNSLNSGAFMGSGGGNSRLDAFGSIGNLWGSSATHSQEGSGYSSLSNVNFGYGNGDFNAAVGGRGYRRNIGTNIMPFSSQTATNASYDGTQADSFENDLLFGDSTWKASPLELERAGPFGYSLGNGSSNVLNEGTAGYVGSYTLANSQPNTGIAA